MKIEVTKTITVINYHTVEAKDEEEALKSITVKNRRERTKRIEYYAHSQNIADEVNIVLNKDRLKRMKKK